MAHDPISGPMPRERLRELADAPFGEAAKAIRKYDPQFGRREGEKFEWEVRVERSGPDQGTVIVMAANEDEACDLAEDADECDVSWDYSDGLTAISAEPHKERS